MQVIVNNLLTRYELEGKGKLVLLLHGWGDSSRGLNGLRKSLVSKYQVLAVDLPGMGGSQIPESAWGLDNYSDFLKDLLKKLDLNQPYAIIGHSNGGAIAIRATSLGALSPNKLILIAASGVRKKGGAKRTSFMVIAKTGKAATSFLPPGSRKRLREKLYKSAGSDMLVAPGLEDTFKKVVRDDVQSDAAKISVPTLLIYAENDQDAPVAYGTVYKGLIKNSKLEVLKNAGHFLHLDAPEVAQSLIEDFLR